MYHVEITNIGEHIFNAKSKDAEFTIGLNGKSITPPDVLLASLGSCMGVYLRKYAEGMKLDIPSFSISVDADFAKDVPVHFKNIDVRVDLKGVQIDERRRKGIIEFLKNCPVHGTLKNNPEIAIELK